tara:strand:- start:479 stop:1120 length:642 start_codon:yes stop_codon:yes gene_type:complete
LTINYQNLSSINKELEEFARSSLLIVSKNQSENDILELINKGYRKFGENRVQEASNKFNSSLRKKFNNIDLHLIGPLQSNKTRLALNTFDTIQTLDRKKIILEISKEIKKDKNIRTSNYFIQVNIGSEEQKSGVAPDELLSIYEYACSLELKIQGIMCIPPNEENPEKFFIKLKQLRDNIDKNLILSMGMSADYKPALKLGSDIVRIGSKIFT